MSKGPLPSMSSAGQTIEGHASLAPLASLSAAPFESASTGAGSRLVAWDLEEDAYFLRILNENKRGKGGVEYWENVEESMRDYWRERRGPTFSRTKNALKGRAERFKNLEEIGINPLDYVPRLWTPEEVTTLLAIDNDHQRRNRTVGIDYSKAIHLFVGRPRFDLKDKKNALNAEAKKKTKQEEDQKRRNAEIEQYKAQVQASAFSQTQQSSSLQAFQSHVNPVPQPASHQTSSFSHASNTPSANSANPHAPFPTRPIAALPQPNQSSSNRPHTTSPHASASLVPPLLIPESSKAPPSPFISITGRSLYSRPPLSRPVKRSDAPGSPAVDTKDQLTHHLSKRVRSEFDESKSGFKEKEEKRLAVKSDGSDVFDEGVELIKKMREKWQELDEEWEKLKEGKGG